MPVLGAARAKVKPQLGPQLGEGESKSLADGIGRR